MTIATRETEILRIKETSANSIVQTKLQETIKNQVIGVVKTAIESALVEELVTHRTNLANSPRRAGYFHRCLQTKFGEISKLTVPKLRFGNKERIWQILTRYQKQDGVLLDMAGYWYMMGLSLRDLQEALYWLLGKVLSRTSVNKVTLQMQAKMLEEREAPITETPTILIVDGVWVDILYTTQEWKEDRAGHRRQVRRVQERVLLTAMAVRADGSHFILHYEVAESETQDTWQAFFESLKKRGLDLSQVKLIVSDGTKGLLTMMESTLPQAAQQRCITHKVRGMKSYLCYQDLPIQDEFGQPIVTSDAKKQRCYQIFNDAYAIYESPSREEAEVALQDFNTKWTPLEPKAVHAFNWGISRTFSFYAFDKVLWSAIRTTNHLERFFREFRTKSDEIGSFPNETSCLALFYFVLLRDHAKYDRFSVAQNS
jgi:transposase-like protein